MDYKGRQRRLLKAMEAKGLDALLVTHLPNVRYLCGFSGSAGVLLAEARPVFFTDGRYRTQALQEATGARVVTAKGPALQAAAELAVKHGARRIGFEAEHVTVAARRQLARAIRRPRSLVEAGGLAEDLRSVKDAAEVECIRAAVNLGARLLPGVLRSLRPGAAESAVAARLEYRARRAGAQGMAFESIIAGGARSALPHAVASPEPLPQSGFVVLDYGVILTGYCSDMTRTVHLGRANGERRGLYRAVLDAQLAAIAAVLPGATAGEVDEAARRELRRTRLAKHFTHSTGHGVGLEIHELPRIASGQAVVLRPGMVITIEPGVYLPGQGGVRIEDMVLVTEHGYEVLTPAGKEFLEI